MAKTAIDRFLSRQPMYLFMFGWVEALHAQGMSITIDKAIQNFKVKNGIDDSVLNHETARNAYHRMKLDLIESQKTHGNGST